MRRLLASAASSRTSPSCAAGAPPPADERAHSGAAGESETSFAGLPSAARTRSVGSVNGDDILLKKNTAGGYDLVYGDAKKTFDYGDCWGRQRVWDEEEQRSRKAGRVVGTPVCAEP